MPSADNEIGGDNDRQITVDDYVNQTRFIERTERRIEFIEYGTNLGAGVESSFQKRSSLKQKEAKTSNEILKSIKITTDGVLRRSESETSISHGTSGDYKRKRTRKRWQLLTGNRRQLEGFTTISLKQRHMRQDSRARNVSTGRR